MAMPVQTEREIAIKDACILFDLVDLQLLADFFRLDFIVLTTPQVIAEITDEIQGLEISRYIDSGRLLVDSFGVFETLYEMTLRYRGLSVTDCSVLELAERRNAVIFSSDGGLRKIAIRQKVVVRGVLWIIEELWKREMITVEKALEKLKTYSVINQRAPLKEITLLYSKIQRQ